MGLSSLSDIPILGQFKTTPRKLSKKKFLKLAANIKRLIFSHMRLNVQSRNRSNCFVFLLREISASGHNEWPIPFEHMVKLA